VVKEGDYRYCISGDEYGQCVRSSESKRARLTCWVYGTNVVCCKTMSEIWEQSRLTWEEI